MMEQIQTIEGKVAAAILEKNIGSIEIGGKTYEIAPPSVGTLILVSELVSTLPIVERVPNEKIFNSVLYHARHFKALGDICAVLILGAKGLTEEVEETRKRRVWGIFNKKYTIRRTVDRQSELARLILEEVRPSVLFDVIVKRLKDMELGSFFSITTSLSEANILKPTREVV